MFKKLSLLCLVLMAMSCGKDENVTASKLPADVSVRDGRLAFTSEEKYVSAVTALELMKPAEQKSWLSGFEFKSLANALSSQPNPDAFKLENGMADLPPVMTTILNSDRLIQFGDDVVYYGDKIKYYMKVDDLNKLSDKMDIMKSDRQAN